MVDLSSIALIEPGRIRIPQPGQNPRTGILAFDSNFIGFPSVVTEGVLSLANLQNSATILYGVNLGYFPVVLIRELVDFGSNLKQLRGKSFNQYVYTFRWTAGGASQTVHAPVLCPHFGVEVKKDRFIIIPCTPSQVSTWRGTTIDGVSGTSLHARHSQPIQFKYTVLDILAMPG